MSQTRVWLRTLIQGERQNVENLIQDMLFELDNEGTFSCLIESVDEQVVEKEKLMQTIQGEERSRAKVLELQHARHSITEEKELRVNELDEYVSS